MKRIAKVALIVLAVLFLLIQFIRPDRSNPPIKHEETLEAGIDMPEDVKGIFARSCNDCHSNKTVYPWYSNISPFSWLLAAHVRDGRAELNFSLWNTYPKAKKAKKLEEICEEIRHGSMPLPSYLWIHRDAVLAETDQTVLCSWADAEKAKIDQ